MFIRHTKKKYSFLVLIGFIATVQAQVPTLKSRTPDSAAIKEINAKSFARHISILASDEFKGRKPFTIGETKTINYLQAEFEKIGLKAGNGDSFFQPVPMVDIKSVPEEKLVIKGENGSVTASYLSGFVAGTKHIEPSVSINQYPIMSLQSYRGQKEQTNASFILHTGIILALGKL